MVHECVSPGCDIYPCFNYPDGLGEYCKKHAKEGMIDVRNKKCLLCNIRPNFNYPGLIRGIYCKKHAQRGMINVRARHCGINGCKKTPSFNFLGSKIRARCKRHADPGMINLFSNKQREEAELQKLKKEKLDWAKNALRLFERSLEDRKESLLVSNQKESSS
jgi:hypothetical protein